MFRASFRAGTITETRGVSSGASGDSASRNVDREIRYVAMIGVSTQGRAATLVIAMGVIMSSTYERYRLAGFNCADGAHHAGDAVRAIDG